MQKTYNNPQISIQMDSNKTDSIYPDAKIMHSRKMIMALKNDNKPENDKKNINESMFKALQQHYGNNKVTRDSTRAVSIYIIAPMVAIKHQYEKMMLY